MWWLRYETPLNQGASSIRQVSISTRTHNVFMLGGLILFDPKDLDHSLITMYVKCVQVCDIIKGNNALNYFYITTKLEGLY
jgi:hypothetical protein